MRPDISYHLRKAARGWRWWLTDSSGASVDLGFADTMALARAHAFSAAISRVENSHGSMQATEPTKGLAD